MHEIDTSNERENIAWANQAPWHGLGQELSVDAGIDVWRREAGLEWSAELADVRFDLKDETHTFDGRQVIYRSDTKAPLSICSDRYHPVQPDDVLEFFRDLVDEYGAFKMEVAGSLRGGTKIWALARGQENIIIGNEDRIARYLLLATSYDQSLPTIVQQTSVRVVCANTLSMAFHAGSKAESGEKQIRVKHITAFDGDVVKQRMMLDEEWSALADALKVLANKKMSDEAAQEFFLDVFYPARIRQTDDFSKKGAERRVNEMMAYYHESPGAEYATAAGTAWGAVNAVTYFVDHECKSRNADLRLEKAWFGDGNYLKTRAMKQALQFATK